MNLKSQFSEIELKGLVEENDRLRRENNLFKKLIENKIKIFERGIFRQKTNKNNFYFALNGREFEINMIDEISNDAFSGYVNERK